ncbi:MAG: DNA topoisomerase IV subunit A [Candidatus Thorarchaeota archaeon]
MNDVSALVDRLSSLGRDVVDSIVRGEFPVLRIPERGTGNLSLAEPGEQIRLGESYTTRSSGNLRHVRSFAQIIWVAWYVKQLLKTGRTSSLRDLYYSSEAFGVKFKDQAESDKAVTDLEALIGVPREDMGVFPEEHSSIYGRVTLKYNVPGYEGREIDLTISPDGLPVGPAMMSAQIVSSDARVILAVESGGMFSRLIETGAFDRFDAILIHLGGQAPRSTRRFMRRLRMELGLPVVIFTDGDPWGMHIAQVIISGSANAAHIPDLAVPDAKWIGVTASDIREYSLPTEAMNDLDLKRLDELSADPRYMTSDWQHHLHEFRELRRKAEQQSFSRYGMDFVVDEYLSTKLAEFT